VALGDDTAIIRRVEATNRPSLRGEDLGWLSTLSPVTQLLRDGLDLSPGVTFLVGENGSGKSTISEAIALAYGLGPAGSTPRLKGRASAAESPLSGRLRLDRSPRDPQWGCYLTAATMRGWYTFEAKHGSPDQRVEWHEMSHGESFVEVLRQRFERVGFYVLDEPEAALSFSACLGLVGLLKMLADEGSQVVCATHSPILTALPGATILELDEEGLREVAWADLELVRAWRGYLDDPQRYLRHLLAD
jgi:predicted ATPase